MQVADTSFSPLFIREQAFSKEILIVHSLEFPSGGLNTLRLPSFLVKNVSVYGAVDLQNFLDRCFKRKYTSNRLDFRELLEKADKKLTLFQRRKKQSINLETKLLIARR